MGSCKLSVLSVWVETVPLVSVLFENLAETHAEWRSGPWRT
jgi:hypothetical protein